MESRYCRQEALEFVGKEGQKKLLFSSVAVVGCGALGSVASELLARAGIGSLVVVDYDPVDITNIQRQSLYDEDDLSKAKVLCLKEHIEKINSDVKVAAHVARLDFSNVSHFLSGADLVLDCTDNIPARLLINEFCRKSRIPWVHSAAVQEKGEVLNVLPDGPCFRCVFPKVSSGGSCEDLGILNSASHVTASIQVVEAIKILLGKACEKKLLRINVLDHTIDKIKVRKNAKCPVCRGRFEILGGRVPDFSVSECMRRGGLSVKPLKNVRLDFKKLRKKFKVIAYSKALLVIELGGKVVVHNYGELFFRNMKDKERAVEMSREIYSAAGVR